ncbi:histidine triad nucleotide-binding protein [Candidatus Ruminimicrobium bovinum]|uniref:histidine triad nucleotide-binding protein n=1 Tax=Candidatus Ruminimicrobium bovinum TaxID=3242779 RepID=UPI0039B88755
MENCIFCKIASGEIPANKVFEDDKVIAFNDLNPQAPVHILIIPKKHIASLADITEQDTELLGHIQQVASMLAKKMNLVDGYRLVNNCGIDGGQTVLHLHYHLMGGRTFAWPAG